MKRNLSFALTCGFAAIATMASAQPPAGQPRQRGGPPPGVTVVGPDGGRVVTVNPQTFEFLRTELAAGRVIRGAPYSGEGVTTTTQTLADGTHIERTVRARFYRDSDGRTRREQTILGLGAVSTADRPVGLIERETETITIMDSVAGVAYTLNPATHEGHRSQIPARRLQPTTAGDGAPPPPPPPPPPGTVVMRRGGPGGGPGDVGFSVRGGQRGGAPAAVNAESLGTRQIEGVTANGTKRTEVIPAGAIGNDRPIEITDERWESPDLQVLVMSKHHDPRTGDVEYRLTNIVRADPPRELFMAPSDYTISDAPPPPPPAPRRPE